MHRQPEVVLDEAAIARKPREIDFVHAAAIPLAGQPAWQGLFRYGQLKAGQSVLIHGGSGGVGHFAVQFAKAKGARVLTTVSTERLEFARGLGADVVIDYKTQRFEDLAQDLDMVFDLVDRDTRERSWPLLKKGGRLGRQNSTHRRLKTTQAESRKQVMTMGLPAISGIQRLSADLEYFETVSASRFRLVHGCISACQKTISVGGVARIARHPNARHDVQ